MPGRDLSPGRFSVPLLPREDRFVLHGEPIEASYPEIYSNDRWHHLPIEGLAAFPPHFSEGIGSI